MYPDPIYSPSHYICPSPPIKQNLREKKTEEKNEKK